MPWIKAKLRGKEVYARATEAGALFAQGGRVEIRYNPHDGRMYRASSRNLEVADGAEVLPEDTCSSAEGVDAQGGKTVAKGGAKKKGAKTKSKKDQPVSPPRDGEIVAYTDGACSGNPGPAGLGVVLLFPDRRIEQSEYLGRATNNVAELTAIFRALAEVQPDQPLVIYTDSSYSIGVLRKGWKAKANQELIAEIREELARHTATRIEYVPGHAGVELNERADELARLAVSQRGDHRREVTP